MGEMNLQSSNMGLNPIQQSVSLVANEFPNIKAVTNYYHWHI